MKLPRFVTGLTSSFPEMKVSEGAYHPSQMYRGLVLDRDTGHLVVLIGPCHNIGCETLNEIFFFHRSVYYAVLRQDVGACMDHHRNGIPVH